MTGCVQRREVDGRGVFGGRRVVRVHGELSFTVDVP
jgi:hypothetical protein